MIDLSDFRLVQGTNNVNPTIDEAYGMNGTAAVVRLNSMINRTEAVFNQIIVDEINILIEEPAEKRYFIEARSSFPKHLTRLTGFTSTGTCTVTVVVDGDPIGTLPVDGESAFVVLDKAVPVATSVSIAVTAVDEAEDLALTLQFERTVN